MPRKTVRPTALPTVHRPEDAGAESIALAALLKGLAFNEREVIEPLYSPDQIAEEAETIGGSLDKFIPAAWRLVEPVPFISNWHIDALSEHLQAITAGDILYLLITMPPRHSKSLIVSVLWPAWEWLTLPSYRWVFASYAFSLSVRDSIKRRKIIQSMWYQQRWADRFALSGEQDTKIRYENDKHGFMLASSVGGSNTGEGGERVVADDPHNIKKTESPEVVKDTVDWWNIVMSTRRNDIHKSARVVVQQRTSESDTAGDIIERGEAVHLNLPTEAFFGESQRCKTFWFVHKTGEKKEWEDPRNTPGELLNPIRFDADANEKAKLDLGDYQYACTPAGTPILMSDWKCKPIEEIEPGDYVVGFNPRGANAGGGEGQKQRLFRSKVLRTFSYVAPVHDLTMSSGRTVRCTADHKWWTRRQPTAKEPQRKQYAPAVVGSKLWFVCPAEDSCTTRQRDLWHYLSGIVDGEGSVKPNILEVSQSSTSNGPTFTKILQTILELELEFNVLTYPPAKPGHGERGQIQIGKCRDVYRKLLRFTDPGKADEMLDCLYGRKERLASESDRVVSISDTTSVETVYALETETGNYIAWGYASSNSQHGQNPTPPSGTIIKKEWLKFYGGKDQPPIPDWTKSSHQMTPLLSLDCTFKKHEDTDYVAGLGWAMFGADIYLMPICIHERLSFTGTLDKLLWFVGGETLDKSETHDGIYPFIKIKLIEDKANGSAIIDTLQHRIPGIFAYEPGNNSKEARLQSASWRFKAGNVYLPDPSIAPWVSDYKYELLAFPKARRDDYVDATSQALLFIGGDTQVEGTPTMEPHQSRWLPQLTNDDGDTQRDSPWGSVASGSMWRIK